MSFEFWKYQGLGNDFVLIEEDSSTSKWSTPANVITICDRHLGIGADGIIFIESSNIADARMVIFNADGSRPEMCGNGLRCFARFIYDRGIVETTIFDVETDRGKLQCSVELNETGKVENIRIEMGAPILERSNIPMMGEGTYCHDETFIVDGEDIKVTAISMGNPHAVLFDVSHKKHEYLGPRLESWEQFPQRTNVEFVKVIGEHSLEVTVYERGCGWTQACGTGACAAALAAKLTNKIKDNGKISVKLPGGILYIEIEAQLKNIWLTGPAIPVFSGVWGKTRRDKN